MPPFPLPIEFGQPPPEVHDFLAIAPIPDHFAIAPEAVALGPGGESWPVASGSLAFEKRAGIEELRIPVAVPHGNDLEFFRDPASGFTLMGDEAVLPLKGAQGAILGTLEIELGPMTGSAQETRAPVEEVRLVTPEVSENFALLDPQVGEVEVQLTVGLSEVPEGAGLKMDPQLQVEPAEEALFRQAALAEGLTVRDFAYQVKVEKRDLVPTEATITLKVDPAWVEAQGGPDQVRIFRDDEQGGVTILSTFYTGLDDEGHAVFVAPSPGLSVFSLTAVEGAPAKKAPARTSPFSGGFLTLVAAIGIGVGLAAGSLGRPPGGGMNPWLRMAMKSSGELKDLEQTRQKKD